MKTIFKTAQIGGKGSMRRKIKKKKQNITKKIPFHQQKLSKLANRFNQIEISKENFNQFNEKCYNEVLKTLNTFTKKFYYKKLEIENKQEFIKDNLLCFENNKKIKFITDFTNLQLYISPKGFDALIDCYFNLWDDIMKLKL